MEQPPIGLSNEDLFPSELKTYDPNRSNLDWLNRADDARSFMLLTVTTTHSPATDLGYLLAKNPSRCQSFSLSFGQAHVFYPIAREDECTAALLLDLDPIGLVRGREGGKERAGGELWEYVNDRPYVASSFMSVAIAQVFGSALAGRSRERQVLAECEGRPKSAAGGGGG
jgi:hypothetical protein